jgi:hypothetical protein
LQGSRFLVILIRKLLPTGCRRWVFMTDCIGLEDMTIDKPRSKIFHFEEKISENNCSQSWAATNLASGRVSFQRHDHFRYPQ